MEKTFWIQGRTGRYWQNLESLENDQAVIVRLGALIGEDRYDELRLIQAKVSQITGQTVFKTIVMIKDGQVIDSMLPQLQSGLHSDLAPGNGSAASSDTIQAGSDAPGSGLSDLEKTLANHPQLHFWETPKPENLQGKLGLDGETNWIQDTQAAIYEEEGAHPASRADMDLSGKTTDDVVEELVSSWKLPSSVATENADISASSKQIESGTTPARDTDTGRRSRQVSTDRRGSGKADRAAAAPKRRSPARRVALMSGVFAGALATGLAISAITPDFAGRFFTGVSGQINDVLPNRDLIAAIRDGDQQSIRARLAEGVDPNTVDALGNPALLLAAQSGNLAAVSLLLQAGADPTLPTEDGISVLHTLAAEGRSRAIARLLDAGAPIDLAGGKFGCLTPLSVAAASGRMRVASLLAQRGASMEPRADCAVGPMEIAIAHPHVFSRLEQLRAEREAMVATATQSTTSAPEADPTNVNETGTSETDTSQAGVDETDSTQTGANEAISDASPTEQPATESSSLGQSSLGQSSLGQSSDGQSSDGIAEETLPPPTEPTPQDTQIGGLSESEEQADAPEDDDALAQASGDQEAPSEDNSASEQLAAASPDPGISEQAQDFFFPPSKPTPPAVITADSGDYATRLRAAIDSGDEGVLVALLGDKPPGFSLDDARFAVEDSFGSGVRTALDQAAMSGRGDMVRLLAGDGATIAPGLVHEIVQVADRAEMADVLSALLEQGANPNSLEDGLSPLMRASLRGDLQTAYLLMAFGADPALVAADGRIASDFARDAGRTDLEERLVLAAQEPQYEELLMGLSWSDTLSTMIDKIEVCKDLGDDFTACKLIIPTWMEDAKSVIAQFDRKASDRLVALQIDSRPIATVTSAIARFEAARREIQARIPNGHNGFVTTEIEDSATLFRDLRPEVNRARYSSYWPDDDRRRPVFVHLKLNGLSDDQGFYRIVIGNPFRAS